MASFTLSVTKVLKAGGKVYVQWSDGLQQEFDSLADAIARTRDTLAESKNVLRAMALARYLRVDPAGANPLLIEGHSVTYTDQNNTMVQVT